MSGRKELLIHAITNACQVFDGWHNDGTAWSEWDECVRKELSGCLRDLYERCDDCIWHECSGKDGGCGCKCHKLDAPVAATPSQPEPKHPFKSWGGSLRCECGKFEENAIHNVGASPTPATPDPPLADQIDMLMTACVEDVGYDFYKRAPVVDAPAATPPTELTERLRAQWCQSCGQNKSECSCGVDKGSVPSPTAQAVAEQIIHEVFPSMDAACSLRYVEQARQRIAAYASSLVAALVKADSMLSILRHRGGIAWGTTGLPEERDVDAVIGEIRRLL